MDNSSLFIILQRMRIPFLVILLTYSIAILGLVIIDGVDANGQIYKMSIFDAFYFVTYTATTIGFGETPYDFTYPQRIWVTFSIYLTVIGWFYGVGSLISLLQDKLFIEELEKNRFIRRVDKLKEKFIIILGYNEITSEIIKKALNQNIRTVVLENDKTKINQLILENFTPTVPVLYTENFSISSLEKAGIKKYNCKAIVSLFEDDNVNLRIALTAKLLNKYIKIAAKSTSTNHTQNLKDLDVEIVANPFAIISSEISMALSTPNLFKLERWLYRLDNLTSALPFFPKGKYIICGYGRLGQKIYEKLSSNDIEAYLIEIDETKKDEYNDEEMSFLTFGNADDKDMLLNLGIQDSVVIIAATNNDTTNLSIVATAKKLNENIISIVRENEMQDSLIFQNANVDHVFMPSKILINKTVNALINPLSDKFIRLIIKQDEAWAAQLVKRLVQKIDENPVVYELIINESSSPEIFNYLKDENELKLEILTTSLHNKEQKNNVIPLLIENSEETILLPSLEQKLELGDKVLLACDEHAKNDIEYICQNMYEFYYALTGKEKQTIFKRK